MQPAALNPEETAMAEAASPVTTVGVEGSMPSRFWMDGTSALLAAGLMLYAES
jgi:hypothetical protein